MDKLLNSNEVRRGLKIGDYGIITKVTISTVTITVGGGATKAKGYRFTWDGKGYKRQGQYIYKNRIA